MNDVDILKSFYSGDELQKALQKYESGIPAAYILGEWEFFGDRYLLNNDCLIPRCDTERVVEKLIESLTCGSRFADVCTGSGCIAISTLKRVKDSYCVAVELSKNAADMAKKNAELNGVSDRLEVICADAFDCPLGDEVFDAIVSNPPYIPTRDLDVLDEYVKKEPSIALDGGKDGMDFYRLLLTKYKNNLSPKGRFIFEIGYDQEMQISHLAKERGFSCKVYKDYSGNPRVAVIEKII